MGRGKGGDERTGRIEAGRGGDKKEGKGRRRTEKKGKKGKRMGREEEGTLLISFAPPTSEPWRRHCMSAHASQVCTTPSVPVV